MKEILTRSGVITINGTDVKAPPVFNDIVQRVMENLEDTYVDEVVPNVEYAIAEALLEGVQKLDSEARIAPTDEELKTMSDAELVALGFKALGGSGSGNFGHEGRPGEVGGSGEGGGSDQKEVIVGHPRPFVRLTKENVKWI